MSGFASYRDDARPYTWLYWIAAHVVIRSRERKRLSTIHLYSPVSLAAAAPTAGPERSLLDATVQPAVRRAIELLPDDLRTTLVLKV